MADEAAAGREGEPALGPLLYLRGVEADRLRLTALVLRADGRPEPELRADRGPVPGRTIYRRGGLRLVHYAFTLPLAADARYSVDGAVYPVNAAFEGNLRIAYMSCNGQERGDTARARRERNRLWARLVRQHGERPFQLLLHGGDQIYADETAEAHALTRQWVEGDASAAPEAAEAMVEALREAFLARYLDVLSQPETAWLMARVPSLAMWDDHDICDGWGSLAAARLDSPVGRALFAVAREHFLLFQFGAPPDEPPEIALDPDGGHLGWHVALPGLHLLAPDLRSERRPDRVMGPRGWRAFEQGLERSEPGRVLVLSSVPALGPRLSWVEAAMHWTSRMEKYEDDLRDQWQSRAHRAEWRAFLERLAARHASPQTPVTVLSGEIHLATRAVLELPSGPLHQLVASGITHPAPPRAYAWALGALARLGGAPLPGFSIRQAPLPGRSAIYAAERNYLVLERRDGLWRAIWELEQGGATPPLAL